MASMIREDQPITAINVTPLVDVTLVLVIIFMITMPFLAEKAMRVNSSAEKVVPVSSIHEPILVELSAQGLRIENQEVALSDLTTRLHQLLEKRGSANVAVSADPSVSHGQVVQVLDLVMQSGAQDLNLLEPRRSHGRI